MPTLNEAKVNYTQWSLADAKTQVQLGAKLNEVNAVLVAAGVSPSIAGYPTGTVVSNAQTGNVNSTAYDFGSDGRGNVREMVLVRITGVGGTTPTCTYAIQGSNDNSTYANLSIADSGTPATFTANTFVLAATGSTTVIKLVAAGQEYRYLRIAYTLNTAYTNTADVYPL